MRTMIKRSFEPDSLFYRSTTSNTQLLAKKRGFN